MVPPSDASAVGTWSRLLSALAILTTAAAAGYLLLPLPLADAFFAAWVLLGVGLSLLGAAGAWTNRPSLVWAAALSLTALSVVGMWSIGLFVAPAAALLLGAALLSRRSEPPAEGRGATDDYPSRDSSALTALGGAAAVTVGAALVYAGAFAGELFGACARETVACALGKTHWDAVGLTVLGLIAVAIGGWTVWRQVAAARAPTANRAR